jgi:hypothetical protein
MEDEKAEGLKNEDIKIDDTEDRARAMGWKPREELGEDFDSNKWVDAKSYVDRKPLFDVIKQQNKELKELKKTVDAIVNFSQKNAELAAKRAVDALKAERKEAISLGDHEKVEEIDTKIAEQKETIKNVPATPPEVVKWTEANDWFNKDPELQDFAVTFCATYAKSHPQATMETILAASEKATKRAFPDSPYFKETSRRQEPPPVETHKGEGKGDAKGKKYTLDRLDDDQKRAYRQFMDKKVMTHDQYFQSLEEIGALA